MCFLLGPEASLTAGGMAGNPSSQPAMWRPRSGEDSAPTGELSPNRFPLAVIKLLFLSASPQFLPSSPSILYASTWLGLNLT